MLSSRRTPLAAVLFALLLGLGCGDGAAGPLPPEVEAPTITTTSLEDGMVEVSYSQTLRATGGGQPHVWSLTEGSLPDGLSLTGSGLISGVPTTDGLSTFAIRVTGSDGLSATASFTIDILPPEVEAPTITTTSLEDGMVGVSYSETLTATGGGQPHVWSLTEGSLPDGLSLTGSGLISGVPTTDGLSTFTIRVTGSDGLSATASFTIDIEPDVYAPGTEWGGGDWPSLVAPALNEDVIMGSVVPRFTVLYDGAFHPELNAVQGDEWHLRITRPEGSDPRASKYPSGLHWSYELPTYTYAFDPGFGWYDSRLTDYDASWPQTDNFRPHLMENGIWLDRQQLARKWFWSGGNEYYLDRWYSLPEQPDLHLSMVHAWVVREGADGDRIFVEGPVTIEHRVLSGVEITDTETFTKTTGWSVGLAIEGISAGLSQTFENSSTHTVSLETETETTETKFYDVPANERWRFIQLYGVDRYLFTDAEGNAWDSPNLGIRSLGRIDNKVRNVLMVVKYRGSAHASYAAQLVEILVDGTVVTH